MTTVSVVIPTYNRADVLMRTLEALARQTVLTAGSHRTAETGPFEVIVVDDGSTDATAELCEAVGEEFPAPFRYFSQPNRKQGAARNLGCRHAQGDLLLFLGDDIIPTEVFLEEHLESHRSRNRCAVVIGYTRWSMELEVTRFMKHIGEMGWQFGYSLIEDPEDVPFNFLYTSNVSLSREFFESAGGFDEDFREYGWEDIELSLRLKKLGMRLVYNARALAHHHHPTSMGSFLDRQHKVGYSAWTFYRKHPEMAGFLHTDPLPHYPLRSRLKMGILTHACRWTERLTWPNLSRYYPDLLSYHYNVGLLRALND